MLKNHKVIVIDDEPIVRAGLENWLSRDYQVQSFDSAEAFLDAFNQFDLEDGMPTCILLDLQMPGMNGLELQQSLKALNAEFPIVFMSGNAQQVDIIKAWRSGAADFLLKPFSSTQVADALKKHFEVSDTQKVHASSESNSKLINIPITKREAEVLLLLGHGHLQAEVAQILGISLRTVKMYRGFLKDKLGLNTLAELGRYCIEHKQSIERVAQGN